MESKLLIMGIDPGATLGFALLDTNGGAHIADLSLVPDDEGRKHLHLVVILHRPSPLPTCQHEAFMRFQSHMNVGMASVIYDGEHLSFHVRAQSLMLCSYLLEFVIIMIVTAIKRILEDDSFNQFLN